MIPVFASQAAAQPPTFSHRPVGCALADRFPHLEAGFAPTTDVAMARVLFQAQGPWYSVRMRLEGAVFTAVLPRPKKSLKSFSYYFEVTTKKLATYRTTEHTVVVVDRPSACKGQLLAGPLTSASVLLQGPPGVATPPSGFASSGVVTVPGPLPAADSNPAPAPRRTDADKPASGGTGITGGVVAPETAGKTGVATSKPASGKTDGAKARGVAREHRGGMGATPLILGALAVGGGATALAVSKGGGDRASGGSSAPSNPTALSYSILFVPSLDAADCTGSPVVFASERVTPDAAGNFDALWPAAAPILRAVGRVQADFQASLNCTRNGSSGGISAVPVGNGEFRGTFKFENQQGQVTITRTP